MCSRGRSLRELIAALKMQLVLLKMTKKIVIKQKRKRDYLHVQSGVLCIHRQGGGLIILRAQRLKERASYQIRVELSDPYIFIVFMRCSDTTEIAPPRVFVGV